MTRPRQPDPPPPAGPAPAGSGPGVVELLSDSEEATRSAGSALAGQLLPGDVVLLEGDLGAGKTTFVQGLAAGLGVVEEVTSPTFTIVHTYRTDAGFDLCHVDLYRLDRPAEVVALGLAETLDDGAVAVIEWGGRAVSVLGQDCLEVVLSARSGGGEGHRRLRAGIHGRGWEDRIGRWAEAAREAGLRGCP